MLVLLYSCYMSFICRNVAVVHLSQNTFLFPCALLKIITMSFLLANASVWCWISTAIQILSNSLKKFQMLIRMVKLFDRSDSMSVRAVITSMVASYEKRTSDR